MSTAEALDIILDLAHRQLRAEVGTKSEQERVQNAFKIVHNLRNAIRVNTASRRDA